MRGQVCKRVQRRMQSLRLGGWDAYRAYLEAHQEEWAVLAPMCRVSVSRFYRDAAVFDALRDRVLHDLARAATARGADTLAIWSAGCASGEEPYTLALLWRFAIAPRHPHLRLRILATDADAAALERARAGCYRPSSLKELPPDWLQAFGTLEGKRCLRPEVRALVEFHLHDLGEMPPKGPFDLVLCRNLLFTYFAEPLRTQVAKRVVASLVPGGVLVVGARERVNHASLGLEPFTDGPPGLFS